MSDNDPQHFFELLWVLTEKELRTRYKYTILGFFWIIFNPILQMLVMGFIFTFFMKEPIEHYYYYLFIGLLIWNFFSLSLTKATPSIIFERRLIKKARFPIAVIPLSIILSNFIHFILGILLYTIVIMFLGTLTLEKIPFLLLALSLLLIFSAGITLLTCALNVRYRDVNFIVQAALIIWFYATPIVYTLTVAPKELIWLWRLNPMTAITQLFQYVYIGTPMPGIAMLTSNIILIFIISFTGIKVFRYESKNFDDWV